MRHFKIWNWPYLRKRPFLYNEPSYFPAIVFAGLLGTYLDLFFTGTGIFSFPVRPFPDVFEIHIVFNLVGLPVMTWAFLWTARRMSRKGRIIIFILISFAGPVLEVFSEERGLFEHTEEWKHVFSFIGYFLFFFLVWIVFKSTNARGNKEN
nr:CBO0543 family protein [Siminovitchia fordii]